MNKYIPPSIVTVIVIGYGLLFHYYHANLHNWNLAIVWSLVYTLPIWIIFFGVELIRSRETRSGRSTRWSINE